jgi:hypothetical protein
MTKGSRKKEKLNKAPHKNAYEKMAAEHTLGRHEQQRRREKLREFAEGTSSSGTRRQSEIPTYDPIGETIGVEIPGRGYHEFKIADIEYTLTRYCGSHYCGASRVRGDTTADKPSCDLRYTAPCSQLTKAPSHLARDKRAILFLATHGGISSEPAHQDKPLTERVGEQGNDEIISVPILDGVARTFRVKDVREGLKDYCKKHYCGAGREGYYQCVIGSLVECPQTEKAPESLVRDPKLIRLLFRSGTINPS